MGHNRLGTLPDTRPWRRVVAHIAEGDSVATVAAATTAAARDGFLRGACDPGVARVVYLLNRAAVAARGADLAGRLAGDGVFVPAEPDVFDFTAALAAAVRAWYASHRGTHTDLAELALLAGAETITRVVGERAGSLFPTAREFHHALLGFATRNGFAHLAHEFFARFVRRFLLYHLSRELSRHVGGNGRFADVRDHAAFLADLDTHCHETARIVREFAGECYDNAGGRAGMTAAWARGVVLHALRDKLAPELAIRGARHV